MATSVKKQLKKQDATPKKVILPKVNITQPSAVETPAEEKKSTYQKVKHPGVGQGVGGGKPPEIYKIQPTPEQITKINNYSQIRLTTSEISSLINISKSTLERWIEEIPEVSDAIKKGRDSGKAHAIKSCFLRAFPADEFVYDDNGNIAVDKRGEPIKKAVKGDTAMGIFLLKTMYKMKEPDRVVKIKDNSGETKVQFNIGGGTSDGSEKVLAEIQNMYDKK